MARKEASTGVAHCLVPMRRLAHLAALAVLSGCAINPYIKVSRPDAATTGASPSTQLQRSVDYANRVIDAYASMPSQEFDRQQATAATLIIGTAGVIGAAAGNAHKDVFVTTGLAGGALYQTANWNSSAGRQSLFIEGRKSLVCAKAALAPLSMSDKDLESLETRISNTEKLIEKANKAAGAVVGRLALVPRRDANGALSTLVAAAQEELAKHYVRLENVNRAIGQAAGGASLTRSAGQLLEAHVDNVRAAIDGGLNDTIASLKNLDLALKGTAAAANLILQQAGKSLPATTTGVVTSKDNTGDVGAFEDGCIDDVTNKPCPPAKNPEVGLVRALSHLVGLSPGLDTAAEALKKLSPMALEKIQAGITPCNPDMAKGMRPLAILPATANLESGSADAFFLRVSGGTTPYATTPVNTLPIGVSVLSQPGGISVTVGGSAPPGSYQLQVSDSAEPPATATFTLTVRPKPPAPPTGDSDQGAKKAALNVKKPAGTSGTGTPGSTSTTTSTTAAQPQACLPIPAGKACLAQGSRCDFECGQPKAQVSAIRGRLGLERAPETFDEALREKLKQFQKDNASKGLVASGDYNAATDKLLFP